MRANKFNIMQNICPTVFLCQMNPGLFIQKVGQTNGTAFAPVLAGLWPPRYERSTTRHHHHRNDAGRGLTGIYNLAAESTWFSRFFAFFPTPRGLSDWHIARRQSAHADYLFARVFLFVALPGLDSARGSRDVAG